MTKLKFKAMSRVFPEMATWGAMNGQHQFIITRDGEGSYFVSMKLFPNLGKRVDLGEFNSWDEAVNMCEKQ